MSTFPDRPQVLGRVRITKSHVDKLVLLDQGTASQVFLRDLELRGFGVRLTSGGAKSFIVEKRIKGRVRRITIGRYPDLTVEQARKEAQKQLGEIACGKDPAIQKAIDRARTVTLAHAFTDYVEARHNLKAVTTHEYGRILNKAFKDWLSRPLIAITKDAVAKRHEKIGTESGGAYANKALRVLRAIFNFAIYKYELPSGERMLPYNPVERLNQTRAWYRVPRRQTLIKPHQLKPWHDAVEALRAKDSYSSMVADYFLLLLYTGLRRSEGAGLQWESIDLEDRTLKIQDPKNHQPLVLPLSNFVFDLLVRRYKETPGEFVFPGAGKRGHLVESREQSLEVGEKSGVPFTLHDLRRTFVTTAERLDISAYAIKRLVNHKMSANDVTAGYVVMDIERLREPMQRITNALRADAEKARDQTVVSLLDARKYA